MEKRPALPALTGLRFLAALLVVCEHFGAGSFGGPLAAIAGYGGVGVNFFFILSGFILAYTYVDATGALHGSRGAFWLARIARVYPVYLLSIALALVVEHAVVTPQGVVGTLTMTTDWLSYSGTDFNPPKWSLSVEAFFYLLFPTIVLLLARCSAAQLKLIAVLSAAIPVTMATLYVVVQPDGSGYLGAILPGTWANGRWISVLLENPVVQLPEFVLGMALGCLSVRGAFAGKRAAAYGTASFGLVGIVMVAGILPNIWVRGGLFDPLFALIIIGFAVGTSRTARFFGHPVLVRLGEASYALYLLHWPVHEWLAPYGVSFPAYLVLTVVLSLVVYRYVEQPARGAIRRLSHTNPRAPGGKRRLILVLLLMASVGLLWHRNTTAAATPVAIGFIGDSITANAQNGRTPADVAASILHTRAVNRAVPSTRTDQWLPGTPLFSSAVATFQANHVQIIGLMLGTNDARLPYRVSPTRYAANLAAICRALDADGFTVVVSFSPHVTVGAYRGTVWAIDPATDALIHAYQAPIRALVARGVCRLGATTLYAATETDPGLLWDGIHPTATGVQMIGTAWAAQF